MIFINLFIIIFINLIKKHEMCIRNNNNIKFKKYILSFMQTMMDSLLQLYVIVTWFD